MPIYTPGAITRVGGQTRQTEIMVYVIEGRLQLDFGGEIEILEVGDCAVLKTSVAGVWSALGKSGCRALVVNAHSSPHAK